jgi:serine/threonine protein phosphatase PrpC
VIDSAASSTRTRVNENIDSPEQVGTKQALLGALTRAMGDGQSELRPEEVVINEKAYYTLTTDEMEALVNGNIDKIKSWVRNLNKEQATRLLYWLKKAD